jgi:hypothetical protein
MVLSSIVMAFLIPSETIQSIKLKLRSVTENLFGTTLTGKLQLKQFLKWISQKISLYRIISSSWCLTVQSYIRLKSILAIVDFMNRITHLQFNH